MIFDDLTLGATPSAGGSPVFEQNMLALAATSPKAAALIRATPPSPDVEWAESDEDAPGMVLLDPAVAADPFGLSPAAERTGRVLASRRRPRTEAKRLSGSVDLADAAAACVHGFGAGYHCGELARRLGKMGALVCFEPDVALLRAVFERVDHTDWMKETNFVLVTEADNPSAITAAIRGIEAILGLGIRVVEHPASRARLEPFSKRFGDSFAKAMRSMRTSVMTTLVRAQASLQNVLMNADHYAASDGIGDLEGACKGVPAVVVAAGPSLDRNLHLLSEPGVRDRVVIIAVQTTLKPLLARGIKPHFVCALDYHELSKRFYDGLTAEDVEGVTLVVEPKANPAILDAFPGVIRCVRDETMESALGAELAGGKAPLKPGATVAHLCSYLARHLGCDPLILIGQDLGFTDGQYYAGGASIHDVWAGELGPVRSLEMFEWERIVRARSMLRKGEDVLGRSIYTDEQMATYLSQFEVDFADDEARGRLVIDATEGGVRKRHTTPMPLAEALAATERGIRVPLDRLRGDARGADDARSYRVASRLDELSTQALKVEALSRKAAGILTRMNAPGATPSAVDRLITEVYAVRDEVRTLEPSYSMVQHINQTGALRRFKADRAIDVGELDERERQRRQIERDIDNVDWTADAALELSDLLRDSAAAIRGERPKATRDPVPREIESGVERVTVGAVLFADKTLNGLGLPRDGGADALGEPALRLTARRLLRTSALDSIVFASGDPGWMRDQLGGLADDPRIRVEGVDPERLGARTRACGRARLMSPDAWRGSLGGLSCYDESLDPALALEVLERCGLDGAVFAGADWCLLDPALVDAVATRYRERPDAVRLSLTQAAPGLAGILLDRRALTDIAGGMEHAANYATVGGALAYLPIAPQADPIAKAFCVAVPHAVRDAGRRLIPDTPAGASAVRRIIDRLGPGWLDADAATLVGAFDPLVDRKSGGGGVAPRHLELELCTGRLASGLFGEWLRGGGDCERPVMDTRDAVGIVERFARTRPDTTLTLHGVGDPLMHPGVFDVVAAARGAGVGLVHLRTDALSDAFDPARLIASGLDVLSIDVLAASPSAYERMAGVNRFEDVKSRVESALGERGSVGGLPGLWVVPRITRCDEVYEEIEPFYDGWLMGCCSAAIDPIPAGAALPPSARIRPLPLPALARERMSRDVVVVRSDGTATDAFGARTDRGRALGLGDPGAKPLDAAA